MRERPPWCTMTSRLSLGGEVGDFFAQSLPTSPYPTVKEKSISPCFFFLEIFKPTFSFAHRKSLFWLFTARINKHVFNNCLTDWSTKVTVLHYGVAQRQHIITLTGKHLIITVNPTISPIITSLTVITRIHLWCDGDLAKRSDWLFSPRD